MLAKSVAKAGKLPGKGSSGISKGDAAGLVGGVFDGFDDLKNSIAELKKVDAAQDEMKKATELMKTTGDKILKVADNMVGMETTDPAKMVNYALIVAGSADLDIISSFTSDEYSGVLANYRQNEVGSLMQDVYTVLDITCKNLEMIRQSESPFTSKEGVKALDMCYDLRNSAGGVADRFTDAVRYMDEMRSNLAQLAASGMECSRAKSVTDKASGNSRRLRHRELQQADIATNEPYYAMTYAALTKLVLDYQLQEAAFQFCKFYEFKNGGVAPPMCGTDSSRTYFTLSQVLQMRSWSPPTYKSSVVRGLLPTKPTYSDTTNRPYPYVDLARLRRGDPVYFTLPTWDLDWLKKYGWLPATTAANKVPRVYLESFTLYLPLATDASAGDPSSASLTTAIYVETTEQQYLDAVIPRREYYLPSQTFTTGATYGVSRCSDENYVTNPYDERALCVQDDSTSDVCMRERGTSQIQNQKRLLPSLFSSWRITANFGTATGGALDLLVPKPRLNTTAMGNATKTPTVGDLMLIADVQVVQISGSQNMLMESAEADQPAKKVELMGSTCCAADEFRLSKSKCQKCSPGTIGAANGYACVPI